MLIVDIQITLIKKEAFIIRLPFLKAAIVFVSHIWDNT